MSMLNKKTREGFTLVELSIAMLFIGVLSVSIVLIISNTVAAYQRGLTLSRVNTAGTNISDDMRVSAQDASVKTLLETCTASVFKTGETYDSLKASTACINDGAYKYTSVTKYAENIMINGEPYNNKVPLYGAFCTGSYSYVWNSGYFESNDASGFDKTAYAKILYLDKNNPNHELFLNPSGDDVTVETAAPFFRLAKIRDKNRAICIAMVDKTGVNYDVSNSEISNIIDVRNIYGSLSGEAVELLPANGGNDLALFDLSVARPAVSTSQDNIFYSVSLILGTTTGGADIMAKGNSCVAPKDQNSGSFNNYCAINKFNFAIQVNGG